MSQELWLLQFFIQVNWGTMIHVWKKKKNPVENIPCFKTWCLMKCIGEELFYTRRKIEFCLEIHELVFV